MQQITQSFLVYYLTGSAAILGIAALATGLPQFLLLLFGGAWRTGFKKNACFNLANWAKVSPALIILIALYTGYLSKSNPGCWWMLIMTSALSGIFNGLAFPARQAMITEIVSREQLMNAVALTSLGQNMCTLAGPSVAGFLIAGVGFKAVYISMVALYLIAVVLTNFLPATRILSYRVGTTLEDVNEGLKYVGSYKILLLVIVFNLLCYILSYPRIQLMPIFATDILNVGAKGLGILQSICAGGNLIAAIAYATLPSKKRGLIMLSAGLTLGLALTVFAFSRSYPLSITMMVFLGIGQSGSGLMSAILVQSLTEKEYLGRAMSILQMCQASAYLGTFFVGIIAQFAGAQWTIGVMGFILIAIASSSLLFLPRLRKLD